MSAATPATVGDHTLPLSLHPFPASATPAATAVARSAGQIAGLGTDVAATIAWARGVADGTPPAGIGRTREMWEALATAAAADVAAARILEPHLDARGILREATEAGIAVDLDAIGAGADASWGVYAAEGARLEAHQTDAGWRLDGTKDWCSLAGSLSHALATAWTGPETRRLFAVSLRQPGVHPRTGPWVSRGLHTVVSASIDFDGAMAVPVGDDGWYLARPGFAWGGMGVAAVWWGAAAPLVHAVAERARTPRADQVAEVFAGAADAAFWSVRAVLAESAAAVDAGVAGRDLKIMAERVRAITATQVESILATADRALGPAPLATDEQHARRVADLRMYLRQHHGERDLARLGRALAS